MSSSNHTVGSLETASIHSHQQRSYLDVYSWCGDNMDSESSHLLFSGSTRNESDVQIQDEQSSSLDIEVLKIPPHPFKLIYILEGNTLR